VLEFDEEKVLALIKKETGYSDELARGVMNQLKTFREELHPYINTWINGEKPNFEFHGISIEEVMQKADRLYVLSLSSMNLILKDPERWVNFFKNHQFKRR
jgi:hypothetical protein